jgi:hypothetical protein
MRIGFTEDLPSATGRSLVLVDGPGDTRGTRRAIVHHARPAATFLAQLVAIAQGAPQTRLRRRASAGHAAALYAAAARIARPSVVKVSL